MGRLDKGMNNVPGGTEQGSARFHHAAQIGAQLKAYKLFISRIFHVIFLDHSWPWVTETMESETVNQGGLLYFQVFMMDTSVYF